MATSTNYNSGELFYFSSDNYSEPKMKFSTVPTYKVENAAERFMTNPDGEISNIKKWCESVLSDGRSKLNVIQSKKGPLTTRYEEIKIISNETTEAIKRLANKQFDLKVEENRRDALLELLDKCQQEIHSFNTELDELAQELPQIEIEKNNRIKEFKDTYNAFKYTSKYYTKYLALYVDVEDMDKLSAKVYFFSQNVTNKDYYITIQKHDGQWKLINSSSQIKHSKLQALQEKLEKDNDMVYVICTVRKMFLKIINQK